MGHIMGTFRLPEALKAEGFPLPANVRSMRLLMGVDDAIVIQYDVFVPDDDVGKFGRALARLAQPTSDDDSACPCCGARIG